MAGSRGSLYAKGASQGELRSQDFSTRLMSRLWHIGTANQHSGSSRYQHLFDSSSAILFLRNDSLHFEEVGELAAVRIKLLTMRVRFVR